MKRHFVAGKADHARTKRAMQVIKRRMTQI
jgi:hypothetical protein